MRDSYGARSGFHWCRSNRVRTFASAERRRGAHDARVNGDDDATFRWFFDNLKTAGGKWDVTGMSHYPAVSGWQTTNNQAYATMQDVVSRYGKPVVVCELGMSWNQAATAHSMLSDLVSRTQALGSNGLGVFYWEPEAYPNWQGYTLGAVNANGQFTEALSAF